MNATVLEKVIGINLQDKDLEDLSTLQSTIHSIRNSFEKVHVRDRSDIAQDDYTNLLADVSALLLEGLMTDVMPIRKYYANRLILGYLKTAHQANPTVAASEFEQAFAHQLQLLKRAFHLGLGAASIARAAQFEGNQHLQCLGERKA